MRKKQIISLILSIFLVMGAVGCSSPSDETPREALEKAFEKELEVVTSDTELDLNLSFTADDASGLDPEAAMMLGAMEDLRLNMRMQGDMEAGKVAMQAKAYAAGMNVDFDLIITEEMMVAQIPMLAMVLQEPMLRDGYIVLRLDELMDDLSALTGEDMGDIAEEFNESLTFFPEHEEIEEITRVALDLLLNALEDEAMENLGDVEISIDGEATSATQITITIGEKEIKALGDMMVDLYETEEMRDFMFEMSGQFEADLTREAFEEEMDEITQEMREDIHMFMEEVMPLMDHEASDIALSFYLDGDYQIIRTAVNSLIVLEPEEEVRLTMDANFTVDAITINEPVEIEIPELTDENSIDLMQLIFQMMFAF